MASTSSIRGQRLLPSVIDELAQEDPERVLYSFCRTNDPADGFIDVNARTFARAINRCCYFIDQNLGPGKDFPTVTYMGPQDLAYGIIGFACIKTGYKLQLNSPRNTLEAHLSLFDKMNCHTFLMPPKFPLPIVKQIVEARKMRVLEMPSLQHWLEDGDVEVYPYNKNYESAKYEPFVVLHTSGSTGLPKPVIQTHATWAPLDAFTDITNKGTGDATYPAVCKGSRIYMTFPLFHCAGIAMLMTAPLFGEWTPVLGPFPPSPEVTSAVIKHGNVQRLVTVPTNLVDMCKNPEHLSSLSKLDEITFGGGPCPQAVGKEISSRTQLNCVLGTTECGVMPLILQDREDWAYMTFSPLLGSEFRHVAGDLYEHFVVRDEKLSQYQGIFGTFPDLQEWPMKDLYSKHPTKENSWLYRGRSDDILVLANGEKVNPLGMEEVIMSDKHVVGALVAGVGQFQSSLLVETAPVPGTDAEKSKILDSIWPSVQAANEQTPFHGRIHRNMVVFTSADKPMARAGKGTIQRKITLDLYQDELKKLYIDAESSKVKTDGHTGNGADSVLDQVRRAVSSATAIDATATDVDTNLFDVGLDSLQVTVVARELNSLLLSHNRPQSASPRAVYSNPTIRRLTKHITALLEGKDALDASDSAQHEMQAVFDELSLSLPISARAIQPTSGPEIVLLTGSTGSLGSYILDSLLQSPQVSEIYCLNRGTNASSRQSQAQASRGLSSSLTNVRFLDADYTLPYFGLPPPIYRQVLSKITTVIHNAWQVDFNLPFDSFTSHLRTVRQLIDFSSHSRFGAHLFFISTIGTVTNYNATTASSTSVPEQIYNDWNIAQNAGYGQSKLVAERLLDAAARQAGVPATVCRVGQVAGPTTKEGIWPKQEWVPSLVASSKFLGKLPAHLGPMDTIDWLPVDKTAQMIVELAVPGQRQAGTQTSGAAVYQLVNPQTTSWSHLLPTIRKALESSATTPIEVVSREQWVEALRQSSASTQGISQNPAAKILDFFEGLDSNDGYLRLKTESSAQASKTLAALGPVSEELMANWLRQWSF